MGLKKVFDPGGTLAKPLGQLPTQLKNWSKGPKTAGALLQNLSPGAFNMNGPNYQPYVPPDPNAPGSIMNMGRPGGQMGQMPAPGTATNGLPGSPNWQAIIAKALQR